MEEDFRRFLKRGGRSRSAVDRCVKYVRMFELYLQEHRGGKKLERADPEDLEAYVEWVEAEPKASAKTHLWAIRYYFEFTSNMEMRRLAGELREERIKRAPFPIREFRGVDPDHLDSLAAIGIRNADQMLEAGRTGREREELSMRAEVPFEAILELVKLSDLSRIRGVKGVRARLYHDAGVDTVEKMARWDPVELRKAIVEFVERTGFEGVATLPSEAEFTVKEAKRLPKVVEY